MGDFHPGMETWCALTPIVANTPDHRRWQLLFASLGEKEILSMTVRKQRRSSIRKSAVVAKLERASWV